MKNRSLLIGFLFLLSMFVAATAQPPIAEWAKIKEIKLLESTREDVLALLAVESFSSWKREHTESFFAKDSVIRFSYSNGTCSGGLEEWNLPEWRVTEIVVTPKSSISVADVGIDVRRFRKERTDPQRKRIFTYYDKGSGIAVSVFGDRVDSIYLFPSRQSHHLLCDNPKVKNYYESKRWAREPAPKKLIIDYNFPAHVTELSIGAATDNLISVSTNAVDPEHDVLTYNYKVSAGKIRGTGASVVWDLSGVKPGSYTITAAVDDGCGICGKYITKSITLN